MDFLEIDILNYAFMEIPANALQFTSTAPTFIVISDNPQLRSIDSQAFSKINAVVAVLKITDSALNRLPVDALLSLSYPKSSCTSFDLSENAITDLEGLPRVLEHVGSNICSLFLFNNRIEKIFTNTFSDVSIENLDLR